MWRIAVENHKPVMELNTVLEDYGKIKKFAELAAGVTVNTISRQRQTDRFPLRRTDLRTREQKQFFFFFWSQTRLNPTLRR